MDAPRIGVTAPNGCVYFSHEDIEECRAFMREQGLEFNRYLWHGERGIGIIHREAGQWCACFIPKKGGHL